MRKYKNCQDVLHTIPFTVQSIEIEEDGSTLPTPYHRLCCPDWVNVLAITSEGNVILIEQPRVGTEEVVLETPGGVCEPRGSDEKDFLEDAKRELEEETGFGRGTWKNLASINPNPATHTNRLHLFLATDLIELGEQRRLFQDENERIVLKIVSVKKAIECALNGEIDHALSVTCILLALTKGYLDEWR